ncbi:1809_t:CDS:2, partial [Entrophospora sp. SA101]
MDYNTNNSENNQISQILNEQNSPHLGTVPKNPDHEYSENINYHQKYIKLLEENEKRDDFRKLIEEQILSINLEINQKKIVQRIKILEDENNKLTLENQKLTKENHGSKNKEFFFKNLET